MCGRDTIRASAAPFSGILGAGKMSSLALSFLGPPLVVRDDAPITMSRRKVLALLAYLAVTGQAHGRDELTELLYPKLDREHAAADFRTVLSLLRHAIGDNVLDADGERVSVRLDDGVRVDVREAKRLLREARAAEQTGDAASAERLLSDGTALFRGEFLAGFSLPDSIRFDEWEEQERDELRGEHGRALERLAAMRESRGEYDGAVDIARRWLTLDALDERVVRALMRLQALAGNRPAALRQYDRLAGLLRAETGERPEVETAALRERIATGRIAADPRGSAGGGGPVGHTTNLRLPPTPLIGRRRELAAVTKVLGSAGARLVTLTGPGGVGKTRLALEAAWRHLGQFEHGAWFVDLAPLARPAGVVALIASTIGMQESRGAPDGRGGKRPLTEQLLDYLRGRRLLLVLDNFEHLLSAAGLVADVLGACPRVKVIVTSREALHLRAEHEMEVPPLALPEPGQTGKALAGVEAVRLFGERARAVQPDFTLDAETGPVVADICRMLDGMPLAIELAAAKVKSFALATLRDLLVHRLRVLDDGPRDLPRRQQTLRGEIDWSFDLLDEGERCLFGCLSVFAGGCTTGSAEAVCVPVAGWDPGGVLSVLTSLVEKSLVQRHESGGHPRFHLLETIREYAAERLAASGDADRVRGCFVAWLLDLVERAEPGMYGPDQGRWFSEIEAEYSNLRAAMRMLEECGDGERFVRMAGSLGWFWFRRARFTEGQQWLERAIAAAGDATPPGARGKAIYLLGVFRQWTGMRIMNSPEAAACARDSLRLRREAGDVGGAALSLSLLGCNVGVWDEDTGDWTEADGFPYLDESLVEARASGDPWILAWCLTYAFSRLIRNDWTLSFKRTTLEEAIDLARRAGDPFLYCLAVNGMGSMLNGAGMPADALPRLQEARRIAEEIDDTWLRLDSILCIARSYCLMGRYAAAKTGYGEGLRLAIDLGARGYFGWFLGGFDYVARAEGRMRRAARLWASAARCIAGPEPLRHTLPSRLGLDPAIAEAEWNAGQAMTLEQAVTYAMSDRD